MAVLELSDRLRVALTDLAALETAIHKAAGELAGRVSPHAAVRDLFGDIRQTSDDHLTAIGDRLGTASGDDLVVGVGAGAEPANRRGLAELHPVSSSLGAMYSLLSEAVIGYSTIQPIATRLVDGPAAASEGTTGHIAIRHTQDYVAAIGRITKMIHDVVIWELEADGLECRCTCPSCGLGVCLCSVNGRMVLGEAWTAARPPAAEAGVEVLRPRAGSVADRAGFMQGDIVIAVDGVPVDSIPMLQSAIRDHEEGRIEFTVRRNGDQVALACQKP